MFIVMGRVMVVINILCLALCDYHGTKKSFLMLKNELYLENKTIDILMNLMVSFLNTSVQY